MGASGVAEDHPPTITLRGCARVLLTTFSSERVMRMITAKVLSPGLWPAG